MPAPLSCVCSDFVTRNRGGKPKREGLETKRLRGSKRMGTAIAQIQDDLGTLIHARYKAVQFAFPVWWRLGATVHLGKLPVGVSATAHVVNCISFGDFERCCPPD